MAGALFRDRIPMIPKDLVPLRVLDPSGSWQLCRFRLIGHGTVFIRVTAASLVPRDAINGEAAPFSVEDPGYAVD